MQSEYIGGSVCKMEISMYDTYVSIDLETTGLNPKRDRIIEIGAIRVEQGQIVEEFSTFVDPGRKLEERITELTGIRDEDLADAPQLDEVFPKLLEFMGELPLLGHSILFDYSFYLCLFLVAHFLWFSYLYHYLFFPFENKLN